MNFLIVSRVSIPAKDRTLPCWEYLRSLGYQVVVKHPEQTIPGEQPDVIISMGVTIMEETIQAALRWPGTPLYCYNWDVYEWVWEPGQGGKVRAKHASRPNEYDYVRYGDLLRQAREIWVPSVCTGRRTEQWYGLKNWHVILSACPWWDWPCEACDGEGSTMYQWAKEWCVKTGGTREFLPDGSWFYRTGDGKEIGFKTIGGPCDGCSGTGSGVRDDGYALCALRKIPDPQWGWFERACEELKIPCRSTRHEVSYEEYQRAVAHCRFIVSPLHELSTGGLTLMEGYYHGKPCLLSDSPWHGGKDYMGGRCFYFRDGDYEDFKFKLRWVYDNTPMINLAQARHWITENFSDRRMVDDMLARIKETT